MNYVAQKLLTIFVVGWIAYASVYLLRKPLGVIKSDMQNELSFTKSQLGLFDTALLLPYALVQTFFGQIGDKFGARKTFGICLVLAGISMITFGAWSSFNILCLLLFFNGAFQSLCWATVNKGLGAWVSDEQRNTIFGYFGTCPLFGGIIGTAVAVHLQENYGWRQAHYIPSLITMVMGGLVLFLFKSPKELNTEIPGKESNLMSSKETKALNMREIWNIPMVPEVAITVFCLKAVRYCMYMWLPMYLLQHLKYSKANAGMFSTMFEVGGIAGSATIGYCLNKFFNNKSLLGSTVGTFLSAIALIIFMITANMGMFVNSTVMIIAGFLNCGPDIILVGPFPTELGEMDGRNAASGVIGLVNGIGSIGTFIEGPIIGWITDYYGWSGMFYSMIMLSFIGTVTCYRAHRIYELRKKHLSLGNILVN